MKKMLSIMVSGAVIAATKATEEGEKSVKEVKDLKKEYK